MNPKPDVPRVLSESNVPSNIQEGYLSEETVMVVMSLTLSLLFSLYSSPSRNLAMDTVLEDRESHGDGCTYSSTSTLCDALGCSTPNSPTSPTSLKSFASDPSRSGRNGMQQSRYNIFWDILRDNLKFSLRSKLRVICKMLLIPICMLVTWGYWYGVGCL